MLRDNGDYGVLAQNVTNTLIRIPLSIVESLWKMNRLLKYTRSEICSPKVPIRGRVSTPGYCNEIVGIIGTSSLTFPATK